MARDADQRWRGRLGRARRATRRLLAARRARAPLYAVLAVLGAVALLVIAGRGAGPNVTYRAPTVVGAIPREPLPADHKAVVSLSAAPRVALAGPRLGEAKLALAPRPPAPRPPPFPVPALRPAAPAPAFPEPAAGPLEDPPAAPVVAAALVRPGPPPPRTGAPPELAIVIDDLGHDPRAAARAASLPGPLTLAFLPYGRDLDGLTAAAAARGHDVFLHLPMEPLGAEDPGPNAILTGLDAGELRRRLAWAFARVPRAVGVNNHMGSRATADPGLMLQVLAEVRRRGLFFVDSRTTPVSAAAGVAARLGLPHAARDVFLDNVPEAAAVRARLDEAEGVARRRGRALAIGHPFPATLATLEAWLPEARRRGVRLVTARALGARAGEGCALLASSAGPPC